jgi:energy-coupling factor transporter ATP-binding protein EcfA2
MLFVGRESEASHIIRELQQGNNVVLGGKYGIGRTSLIKEIASLLQDEWRFIFVDFSQTSGKMSEKLIKELHIPKMNRQTGKQWGYKSMLYRIVNVESPKRKKTVIVFDNIVKLTPQKIFFLRHLILEKHFQFVAIVENFLPVNDLLLLKAQLIPVYTISLHYLKEKDVISFIRLYSEKNHLDWSDAYIHSLAYLAKGYPLGMIEMIKKKRRL